MRPIPLRDLPVDVAFPECFCTITVFSLYEMCVCVLCVCVCVLIKLHITAQSGPVILVILCHSHWSSQEGINDTCYENL